ncbi:MAG: DMT family transporter [Pikeienuella sp.]
MPHVDPAPEAAPPQPAATPAYVMDNARGAGWMMFSVIFSAVMAISVKWAAVEMDSRVIVLDRSIGALVLGCAALLASPRLRAGLRFSAPWLHIWRGALVGISTHFGYYSLTALPLATATVLFFSAPIFTAMLAAPLLGEKIGPRRAGAIAAGFLGVGIVLRPGADSFQPAMLAGIASSLLFAVALLSTRGLANRDGAFSAFISSTVVTILVSAPAAAPVWAWDFTLTAWVAIALVAISGMGRTIADIEAYRLAEAAILAPLSYLRLILIAAASYLIFDETPDGYTIAGGAVIIAAALYIAHRERLVKRRG